MTPGQVVMLCVIHTKEEVSLHYKYSYKGVKMLHATSELLSMMVPILLLAAAKQEPELVIGLVNSSIQLSTRLNLLLPVQETVWKFTSDSRTVKVAEVGSVSLLTYSEQFKNRIEAFRSGTSIVIQHLSLRDAGEYCAEIILASKEMRRSSFILTVYEPVSSPAIWTEQKENTTDQCNVTLHCSVPSITPDFSYTWKRRHRNSELYLYSTGSSIRISLPPDQLDMEFLCIVKNPADLKNVSVHIGQFCVGTNIIQNRGAVKNNFSAGILVEE
ncbi:SLAM family member 9-like isoform X2 [Hyla sarda]|uniref:SLAM family member 9-like isoform X2 n=1 Tax=Hyla sarda TaxID=327740 RepID=UPI0024C3F834|nr:SLAM family member 9-like isoform X2 [Hyla sarda]